MGIEGLETLLIAVDLETDPQVIAELKRWHKLLISLRQNPTPEIRSIVKQALLLCGLLEATVQLAIDTVIAETIADKCAKESSPSPLALSAKPSQLEWTVVASKQAGDWQPGTSVSGERFYRSGSGIIWGGRSVY